MCASCVDKHTTFTGRRYQPFEAARKVTNTSADATMIYTKSLDENNDDCGLVFCIKHVRACDFGEGYDSDCYCCATDPNGGVLGYTECLQGALPLLQNLGPHYSCPSVNKNIYAVNNASGTSKMIKVGGQPARQNFEAKEHTSSILNELNGSLESNH